MMQGKVMGGGKSSKVLDMPMNGSSIDLMGHTVTDTDMTYDANNAIFNSTTSKITVNSASDLSFNDGVNDKPFTINCKITPSATGDRVFLYKCSNDLTTREYGFYIYDNQLYIQLFTNFTNRIGRAYSITLSVGTTYELCVSYDGLKSAVSSFKMYVNKVLVSTNPVFAGTYTGMVASNVNLNIGNFFNTAGYTLKGKMDYINIYNEVLTPSEIDAL